MTSYKLRYSMVTDYVKDETSIIKRSENKLDSGHVQSMQFDGTLGVLRGVVKASMRNQNHQVEVHLNRDGIDHGSCTCARGLHPVCSHRVAILLYGLRNISPTDSACSWRAPSGSAATTSSVEMMYPPNREDYDPTDEPLREEDKMWFRDELKNLNRFTGFYWLLQDKPIITPEHFPWSSVKDVLQHHHTKEDILGALVLSSIDVEAIADRTKGQRENQLWFNMKFGRLTASNFGSIIKAIDINRFPKSLFSNLLGKMSLDHVKSIQYGITHEAAAIDAFEKRRGLKVVPTGIWLDTSGLLGASPDGLVGEDAIIEVKCPYKHRESTGEDVMNDPNYCFIVDDDGEPDVKGDHMYYHQIQGQLHILNRSLCYFVVYGQHFTLITEVSKDPEWEENLGKMKEFYVNHFLEKLMD